MMKEIWYILEMRSRKMMKKRAIEGWKKMRKKFKNRKRAANSPEF
jgi:hypothetical protein